MSDIYIPLFPFRFLSCIINSPRSADTICGGGAFFFFFFFLRPLLTQVLPLTHQKTGFHGWQPSHKVHSDGPTHGPRYEKKSTFFLQNNDDIPTILCSGAPSLDKKIARKSPTTADVARASTIPAPHGWMGVDQPHPSPPALLLLASWWALAVPRWS